MYIYNILARFFNFLSPLLYYFIRITNYRRIKLLSFEDETYYVESALLVQFSSASLDASSDTHSDTPSNTNGKIALLGAKDVTALTIYYLRYNEPSFDKLFAYLLKCWGIIATTSFALSIRYIKNNVKKSIILYGSGEFTRDDITGRQPIDCGIIPF